MILREHNRNVAFTICCYKDTLAFGYINGDCEMVNVEMIEAFLGYVKDITCSSTKFWFCEDRKVWNLNLEQSNKEMSILTSILKYKYKVFIS